jgi:uroporphyrinogen III methyltransferase / synthase
MSNLMIGKVFLVGAGVGGVAHLTIRARNVLANAEMLIYDALVDSELINLVPLSCDRISVGKRGGHPSFSQTEINRLLVENVLQGKQVVRLKSGDPLIFGRAIAELRALVDANCDFELVPGISSAIAAPLFAGIPLTDPNQSSCFAVLSAHDLEILPWDSLAQLPTLVILMGTGNIPALINRLQQNKSADTAIAIIQWCGSPQQKVWNGTLANILNSIPNDSLSPSVIIVGEVVNHSAWIFPHLCKLEIKIIDKSQNESQVSSQAEIKLALAGKTILVTRAAGQSSNFSQTLQKLGANVVEMPTLEILPPKSWLDLDRAIANLANYDWLILTSANGVDSFFQRLNHAQKDSRALTNLKIAVVGEKTAKCLKSHGILADLIPPNFIAEALIESFSDLDGLSDSRPSINGKRILFPRVESGGREILIEQLTEKGAVVSAIAAYESGCPSQIDQIALAAIQSQRIDLISFASAKTVKHFAELLDREAPSETWKTWIASTKIASIGTQTSIACQKIIGRVDCEAAVFSLDGLAIAISDLFNP